MPAKTTPKKLCDLWKVTVSLSIDFIPGKESEQIWVTYRAFQSNTACHGLSLQQGRTEVFVLGFVSRVSECAGGSFIQGQTVSELVNPTKPHLKKGNTLCNFPDFR